MKVKIKKTRENAVIPQYAHDTDAGLDLTSVGVSMERNIDSTATVVYYTGLSIEIPEGYVGLIFPRSSISKKSLTLANAVGVVDAGYRGEIICKFKINTTSIPDLYEVGDRVAQLIILPYPKIELEEVEQLTESERGENGFGSTNEVKNEEAI